MEKITDEDLKELLTDQEVLEDNSIKLDMSNSVPITLDSLQTDLEKEIDFNTIPENIESSYEEKELDPVLQKRNNLTVGLTPEDYQALFDYIAGKTEKPDFVDRFMTDTEGRLKEMSTIMALVQLSRIPTLTAYNNQLQERLFDPSNLYEMDLKTLSSTMTNINKDIMNILDTAIKTVQTNNQFGSLTSEYRKIIDNVLMLPADKLQQIQEVLSENANSAK